MDYESISRNLMNYSIKGYVLEVSESGNEVAWMKRKGDDYIFETLWCLGFDMLDGFDYLREVMKTETLIISFNAFNVFEAELSHKKRDGGCKEPFYKVVYDTVKDYSILEVLSVLNEREKSRKTKNLLEEISLKLSEGYIFNLLPNGKTGAWLVKQNDEYVWDKECKLPIDVLENKDVIRKSIHERYLIISYKDGLFAAEIYSRQRIGGNKEPF